MGGHSVQIATARRSQPDRNGHSPHLTRRQQASGASPCSHGVMPRRAQALTEKCGIERLAAMGPWQRSRPMNGPCAIPIWLNMQHPWPEHKDTGTISFLSRRWPMHTSALLQRVAPAPKMSGWACSPRQTLGCEGVGARSFSSKIATGASFSSITSCLIGWKTQLCVKSRSRPGRARRNAH